LNLGIGSKLFLTSVGIILVVESTAAIVLRSEVRETLQETTRHELVRHAESARIGLETLPDLDGPKGQALAEQIAKATSTEVEVFDSEGNVLADTDPDSHPDVLSLPEVRDALDPEKRGGSAYRGRRVLVARPFKYGDGLGVVRLAATRKALDRAYDRLWVLLTIGAAIGLVVALGMTIAATALIRRSLRRLATSAAQVAAGGARRIAIEPHGEIGEVGDFINQMADDAERTVRALVHERALLGSVLDGMSQCVIGLDADRRMTLVNPAARDMLDQPLPVGEAFIDAVRLPALVSLVERRPGPGKPRSRRRRARASRRACIRSATARAASSCSRT
jgi:two-component system phosphate regulon sensor histidine kinase PhoR